MGTITLSNRVSKELNFNDFSDQPTIPRRVVIAEVPSGEIVIEQGADGIFLRFECDCIDALPMCQAQCCGLPGTVITPEELERLNYPAEWDDDLLAFVLERGSDGFCQCLDRRTRMCQVYDQRPYTCKSFHCTRGATQRGWKIPNKVFRQNHF